MQCAHLLECWNFCDKGRHAASRPRRSGRIEDFGQVIARAPRVGIVRQQASMALCDVKHDRPRFEQGEIAFLIGWNLSKRPAPSPRIRRAARTGKDLLPEPASFPLALPQTHHVS